MMKRLGNNKDGTHEMMVDTSLGLDQTLNRFVPFNSIVYLHSKFKTS